MAGMRPVAALVALLLLAAPSAAEEVFRDQSQNPAVSQETLATTVCVRHYTRSVRPSWAWARAWKARLMAAAGFPPETAHLYQLDHVLPLTLGGAGREPSNLALQEIGDAKRKDGMERRLGCLVCRGDFSLSEARAILAGPWREGWSEWKRVQCRRAGN